MRNLLTRCLLAAMLLLGFLPSSRAQTISGGSGIAGAIPAGSSIIGKVGVDQTTPGTTNGVAIAPTSGTAAGITSVVSASAEASQDRKSVV